MCLKLPACMTQEGGDNIMFNCLMLEENRRQNFMVILKSINHVMYKHSSSLAYDNRVISQKLLCGVKRMLIH